MQRMYDRRVTGGSEMGIIKKDRTAIVVGSGAGGATMALDLQKRGFQVTMLEEGGAFTPFKWPVDTLSGLRRTGLFLDPRMIRLLFPNMHVEKSAQDMVLVKGRGLGGTTTLATGNAVRCDAALQKLGINLDNQYAELYREVPITTEHRKKWNRTTDEIYRIFEDMDLQPVVTPKMLDAIRCRNCSHCAIGCPYDAKWDTRKFIEQYEALGGITKTHNRVTGLEIRNGQVKTVLAKTPHGTRRYEADVVVLSAGGLGTPLILEQAGIACDKRLFVDPVMCVAAPYAGSGQDHQLLMPFISQQDGYMLSPYMDYLSFFFDKKWRGKMGDIVSLMIKFADEEQGEYRNGKWQKGLTAQDRDRMLRGVEQCKDILGSMGIARQDMYLGILNAGHPGGMLPLTAADAQTLHPDRLPDNLYIADGTLLPEAMGNPPILTIMALARKIASVIDCA